MEVDSKDVEVKKKKKCCCFGARGDGIKMQWLLLFSLAVVYTVQIMRWKGGGGGIKSGRMSQISELPVGRSLAWPVALSTLAGGVERDLVSA